MTGLRLVEGGVLVGGQSNRWVLKMGVSRCRECR